MGLLVGDHLQGVLDPPERDIARREIVTGRRVDPLALRQRVERLERAALAKLRVAPAGDELLGLDEELDLANAAATELDVVAGDRDLLVAAMVVDLPLDRVNVADRGVVEVLPPDVGDQLLQEGLARRDIAGDRPRFDQRRALPVLPEALVVLERRLGRDRDVGGAWIGAEAEVGAEDVAVLGMLVEDLDQFLGQPDEKHRRFLALGEFRHLGIEEDDEVDIARIVELARTELAHAEDDPAGVPGRVLGVRQRDLSRALGLGEHETRRRAGRCIGEGGQRRGHFHHVPHPAEIGERRQQGQLLPAAPEAPHQLGLIPCAPRLVGIIHEPFQARLRLLRQQRREPRGVVEHQSAKVGGIFEDGTEKGAELLAACEIGYSGHASSLRRVDQFGDPPADLTGRRWPETGFDDAAQARGGLLPCLCRSHDHAHSVRRIAPGRGGTHREGLNLSSGPSYADG